MRINSTPAICTRRVDGEQPHEEHRGLKRIVDSLEGQTQAERLMHVLIIDDDPEFRLQIGTQLQSRNIAVDGAADGIQAIIKARGKQPDVILLDLGLPGGDGFLILERLKANTLLSPIPVIIVTARDMKEVEEKAFRAGAASSLQKPVNIDGLLTVIEEVLRHSRQTGKP